MNIQLGEKVQVFHRTNGNGKMQGESKPFEDHVVMFYHDGAVELSSGDVWKVTRKNGVLRTTHKQERVF